MTESTATEEALVADPALEVDEQLPFDPSALPEELLNNELFMEAAKRAHTGQYQHTFFEVFEDQLEGSVAATEAELTVEVADSILKAWPWLRYVDLELYLVYRSRMLRELLSALVETYPLDREVLFAQNADDWKLHREAYMELMVQWTAINNKWTKEYQGLRLGDRKKAILHCVIADLTYITLGPDGMVEKFKYIAFFDHPDWAITKEESDKMQARIKELSDE
jgi:hypothetical protein